MTPAEKHRKAVKEYDVATIDIRSAHICWVVPGRETEPMIKVFRFLSPEDRMFSEETPYFSDSGACYTAWEEGSLDELLDELKDMVAYFSASGIPMQTVIREFSKIREFAALGSRGGFFARTLSLALIGEDYSSQDFWMSLLD